MHQIVHLQAPFGFVHFSAFLTAIGSGLGMILLMSLQMRALLKSFLAFRAFVRLLRGVDACVMCKIDFLHKLLATDITLVLLVIAVYLAVHPHAAQLQTANFKPLKIATCCDK